MFRDAIKNDSSLTRRLGDGNVERFRGIEFVVSLLKQEMEKSAFLGDCLGPNFALVPIPRSAPLHTKVALWPSR